MTVQIYSYIFFLSLCENAINWLCSHQHIELLRKASLHDLLPPMSKAVNENCTNLPDNLTRFRYIFIDIKRWLNAKFAINLCFSTTQQNLRIRPLIPSHHLYNWIVLNSHTERIDKEENLSAGTQKWCQEIILCTWMAVWLMKKNSVIELATNRTYIGLLAFCKETEGEKRRWTSSEK